MRLQWRSFPSLLGACATLACDANARPYGAVAFTPPSVYARWWALAEECSGLSGSLKRVQWLSASPNAIQAAEGSGTVGYWSSKDNRIVLATNAVTNGRIVRHEMLHALSRSRGHPDSLFRTRCEGVVRCDEECRGGGSSIPPAGSAVPAPVESLLIAISAFPVEPARSVDDGAFQIIVSVAYPASHAVVVGFRSPDPAIAMSVAPGNLRLTADHEVGDPRLAIFGPRERKQYVFDLRANDTSNRVYFNPGAYRLTGHFDGLSTAPLALVVGQ